MKPGEGYVIFCEDVRSEVSGQSTAVGMFPNDIVFTSALPSTMAKLGLIMHIYLDVKNIPDSLNIEVTASWADEPLAELSISVPEVAQPDDEYLERYPRDDLSRFEGERPRVMHVHTTIPNLEVPREGMVRVVTHIEGESYLLGRKYIRSAYEEEDIEDISDDDASSSTERPEGSSTH